MLAAAADPTGDITLLWRAAQTLGIGREAAAVTGADKLVEIAGQVRFRHPLVRSAIYSAASAEDRRAVHSALASATDSERDPDRRAWHRALAAAGPDDEIASELEQAAGRAQSRGGLAAAAALLERSVGLTDDPARRADRALAATQAQINAGAFDEALKLLASAETDAGTELQRGQLELLRAQMAFAVGFGGDGPGLLLKAAVRLENVDTGMAGETLPTRRSVPSCLLAPAPSSGIYTRSSQSSASPHEEGSRVR
jgi:hypothetical protein